MRSIWLFLYLMVGVACLVPAMARAGQIACADVVSNVNQKIRLSNGGSPDISRVATEMGSTPAWVEHCMRIYGRRARRPCLESTEGRESHLEQYESEEPEETAPEDFEEPGADLLPKRAMSEVTVRNPSA